MHILLHKLAKNFRSAQSHQRNSIETLDPELSAPASPSIFRIGSAEFARWKDAEELSGSSHFKESNLEDVPPAEENIRRDSVLGVGSFSTVREITSVNLKGSPVTLTDGNKDKSGDFCAETPRAVISNHCVRGGGDARYTIKYLNDEAEAETSHLALGLKDMTIETRFLASIDHPNLIRMHALAHSDHFDPNHFIVLDRLHGTLDCRIHRWAKEHRKSKNLIAIAKGKKKEKEHKLLADRLTAAYDVSAALENLHSLNIIHRDIKPENIGFDARGNVKLFDFGLAKELDPSKTNAKGTYKLTGCTGSQRYMAPEVALCKEYGFSADVFSFCILFWEMLALSVPFAGCNIKAHMDLVVREGLRPIIDSSWSERLRLLLQQGWSGNLAERPSMSNNTKILKVELAAMQSLGQTGPNHKKNRGCSWF